MKFKLFLSVVIITSIIIPSSSLPMHESAQKKIVNSFDSNDLKLVQKALEEALAEGANINLLNDEDYTVLCSKVLPSAIQDLNIFELLLKLGADANRKDEYGNTPLYSAITYTLNPNINVIKILLNAGADISIKNANNQTALDAAIRIGEKDIVKLFEEWPKELRKKVKEETSAHLIPDLSDIVCGYVVD